MKSATKVVRTSSGRTLLIVGNRKKLSTEAEIVQRVADEAGVPVGAPAYPRPIGAARGEQLAEAEKTRLMSEVLRRGGVGGDLSGLMHGKDGDDPASGEAHDWRIDIPSEDPFDDDSPVRDAQARREKLQHFADKAYRLLRPVSRIVFDRVCAALDGDPQVDARIAARQNLLVVLRCDRPAWSERIPDVMRAWLARRSVQELREIDQACAHVENARRDAIDFEATVTRLTIMHVAASVRSTDKLPASLLPLVDVTVDLTAIGFDDIGAALRGRFPDAEIDVLVEPEGFDLLSVGADFLDAAIARATTAAGVISLAKRMSEMRAEELAAERKVDEKPKLGGSSKPIAIDILRPTEPKLESLHGYGQAATWATDLVRDLADYRAGKLGWADVDSGCLLSGPPGTGKTLFASALAASAGLPFIASSFAQWQGSRGGHLGDVVKALRETFAMANANSPCILFIDELDSVPARGGSRDYDDYWIPIVNGLLECLDGTTRREGVVVLAASNHPEKIDPALLRSGRLDRRFEIGLPDERALASIFAHHLPNGDPSAFATAATVLAGSTSGADVSRIAREARRIARRAGREIVADDLLSIAMPADTLSACDRRLAAVHEAGHAVAAMVAGETVCSLSIVTGNGQHGGVTTVPRPHMMRASELEASALRILAGRAAEEVVLEEVSGGAYEDLAKATEIVRRMIGTLGLGTRLVVSSEVPISEVEIRLRELYSRALRLITEHRRAVEALADLAIEKRVLGRAALGAFAREHGLGGGR